MPDLQKIPELKEPTCIYSMWEGYIDKGKIKRLEKFLSEKNGKLSIIHTGGHADFDTLKEIVESRVTYPVFRGSSQPGCIGKWASV